MRGRGGFLRIVEAFVAIMIIAGVMGYVYVQKIQKPDESEFAYQIERVILSEIENNATLRDAVLSGDSSIDTLDSMANRTLISNAIKKSVPAEYNYDFRICSLSLVCNLEQYTGKEVFANDVTISSTLYKYNPKKLRIFLWIKY